MRQGTDQCGNARAGRDHRQPGFYFGISHLTGGETVCSVCHAEDMAKKRTKHTSTSSTEWQVGQPLAWPVSPSGIKRAAREAVNEAMRGPFNSRREKRKKK
jgi:hypothetical protein